MANLAFDSSVTLVVKTPNQKIDDLRVDCALEWTVKQLKGHLSRVYPTKPASQHQRLIYSGQLLLDHLILRDVLREHEDGKSHTLHLVCPVKGEMPSTADSPAMNGSGVPPSVSSPTQATPSTPVSSQTTPDGLRYRGNNTPPYPQFSMYHQQVANAPYQFPVQGHGYPMPPFAPPPYWMQQMFAQQMAAGRMPQPMMYMSPNYGFPQMPYPWSPGAGNVPSPQGTFTTPPAQQIPQTPPQPPANQAPQQPANENAPVNANGGPLFDDDDDDENANRDWLDKIYTLCRVGILLSIFWFYSSTGRFLLLIASLVLIYLYQTGILQLFRRNRILGNNPLRQEIPPPVDVPQQVEQQQQQQQETEASNRSENDAANNAADNDSDHANNDTDPVLQQPAVPTLPPEPSATTVAYNFVISFFTSLFPNGPPGQN